MLLLTRYSVMVTTSTACSASYTRPMTLLNWCLSPTHAGLSGLTGEDVVWLETGGWGHAVCDAAISSSRQVDGRDSRQREQRAGCHALTTRPGTRDYHTMWLATYPDNLWRSHQVVGWRWSLRLISEQRSAEIVNSVVMTTTSLQLLLVELGELDVMWSDNGWRQR